MNRIKMAVESASVRHYKSLSKPRSRLRLQNYCYKSSGHYFVTICTNNRKFLFGRIIDNRMKLSAAGLMIEDALNAINDIYRNEWFVDTYIVMPDHIHVILVLDDCLTNVSLPKVVSNFKSYTTVAYIRGVQSDNWETFNKRLWQRSYHERIIRSDNELNIVRKYIANNPAQWIV